MLDRLKKWVHRFLTEEPDADAPWPAKRPPKSVAPQPAPSAVSAVVPAPTRVARHIMPSSAPAPRPVEDTNTNAQVLGAMVGYQILTAQAATQDPAPDCAPAPTPDAAPTECAAPPSMD